jgi:hypothetical protein
MRAVFWQDPLEKQKTHKTDKPQDAASRASKYHGDKPPPDAPTEAFRGLSTCNELGLCHALI